MNLKINIINYEYDLILYHIKNNNLRMVTEEREVEGSSPLY